jgi:DNA repair protein RadC
MKKKTNPLSLFTVTEVELVYRSKVPACDRPQLNCSSKTYDVLMQAWDQNKIELVEQFGILLLNRSLHCLGVSFVATGGISACSIDPKIIFATALKVRASSLILAHNHPSGNTNPSPEDKTITRRLSEGGKVLGIDILDHMIVTPRRYLSFADEGLMP